MNNLELYEKVRSVPQEAQKTIAAGRLKGMTDINPMWRIKTLTEQFGVCGFGWKIDIVSKWIEDGANEEKTANVHIKLYVKMNGEWSEGIDGIGGSSLVTKEKNGLYTDDECYKKAYTDAISVACKALGIGADVYWDKDATKYDEHKQTPEQKGNQKETNPRGIQLSELRDLGVEDVSGMAKYLGEKLGKSISEFDEGERETALEWVKLQVAKKKAQKQLKEAEGEVPFE